MCFSEEDSEERPRSGGGSGSGAQQQDSRRQSLSCDCSWSINRLLITETEPRPAERLQQTSGDVRSAFGDSSTGTSAAAVQTLWCRNNCEKNFSRVADFYWFPAALKHSRCSRGNLDAELRSYWEMSLRWIRCQVSVQNWKCESRINEMRAEAQQSLRPLELLPCLFLEF